MPQRRGKVRAWVAWFHGTERVAGRVLAEGGLKVAESGQVQTGALAQLVSGV